MSRFEPDPVVHEPDMSMFTLGGGGVHCLSQALYRDPA